MDGWNTGGRARGFVVMPFGRKPDAKGEMIDFDLAYHELIAPALHDAGIEPFRADVEIRAGSIHADMFQELLFADIVVADLTIDNANAFYELGIRHALRDNATVSIFSGSRMWLPFDVIAERSLIYSPIGAPIDREAVLRDRAKLTDMVRATLGAWRGRKTSPVYRMLPNLEEPQWKRLKVGDINEFWQKLDAWRSLVTTAVNKQRPGDILLLADETPNRIFELEALEIAARALLQLNSIAYALAALERGLALDPDNLWFRQQYGLALGRSGRFVDARTRLSALAQEHRSGETIGLLGRCYKDHWLQLWCIPEKTADERRAKAKASAVHLEHAVEIYAQAFQCEPSNFYPGVNALTLGHLWEHLTGKRSKVDLQLIAQGVRWAVACAIHNSTADGGSDYWALATRAELRLVADGDEGCFEDFEAAASQAVVNSNLFALTSTTQQLALLHGLGFRTELVEPARLIIEDAEQQLAHLVGKRCDKPQHVVLFSGHMIDDPHKRGESLDLAPRFPAAKVEAARDAIEAALDRIGVAEGDLGLCGGACGGDLLFAEACLARGMNLDVRLAQREPQFLAESVTFADADESWFRAFQGVTRSSRTRTLIMPDEVGPTPEGVSVHDRNNRWQLYSALSEGLEKVQFIALWDGKPAGGPGGTEEMVNGIRRFTGRAPIIIDPAPL